MKRLFFFLPLFSLVALLPLEVFLDYDTGVRKAALVLTCLVVVIVLVIFLRQTSARQSGPLSATVAWLAVLGVWCDALGNFLHFYARLRWWDQLAHGVGTAALALALWAIISYYERTGAVRLGARLRAVFAVSLASTIAALYEISEYVGDQWFATHRVTDLYDTADDLFWNLVVSTAALLVVTIVDERKKNR